MANRLLGIETEYALGVRDPRTPGAKASQSLEGLMRGARSQLPHLPDGGTGLFLQNGARFYPDLGGHPEMTTPECADPWDVVRYVKAGEAILLRLAKGRTAFFRSNVDYSGSRATWGCHESYLHRADPRVLPKRLIPHLVSRVVYAGAGGFNNVSPGIEFTLSPRAVHMACDVSNDSMRQRGIFHTKDESLCGDGWHRLHVLCGESLCSELATWLKVGTTALVVALSEAGRGPGDAVVLRSPVEAMRRFAGDPTGRVMVEAANGRRLTAVDIQRRYLEHAEAALDSDCMPPWAGAVCRRWRAVLNALADGRESMTPVLDWAIKLALYRRRVRTRGLAWESLPGWTQVATQLLAEMRRLERPERALTVELVLGRKSPLADEVTRLGQTTMRELGLRWDDLGMFLAMRDELFEIDTRFGQLGEGGIFTALDAAGVLAHHVEGVDDVEGATANPPATGRARVRGELVRALAGGGERYVCSWHGGWDNTERRRVDLGDPFTAVAEWAPGVAGPGQASAAAPGVVMGSVEALGLMRRMERAARAYTRRFDPSG